jgi:periplasmic protein TonB
MNAHSDLKQLNRIEAHQEPVPRTSLVLVPRQGKVLFADSLLEATGGQKRRRIWALAFSSILQCLLVGSIVILSLWYTQVLPREELLTMLTAPPAPPAAPAPPQTSAKPRTMRAVSNIANGMLTAPSRIPNKILMVREPEPIAPGGFGVIGGVPGGVPGGELDGILNSTSRPRVVMQAAAPKRVRVSQGVAVGMITAKIDPLYPPIAIAARVEGVVLLKAIIAKDGTIQNMQVISGPAMLVPAAEAAVKQWRYRPYLLDGEPVEVETTVQVIFQLQ